VRRVLLVTGAVVFFNSSLPTALAPLLPRLADEFALSKGQSGLLTAAFGAGIVVGTIPALVLASGLGVKPSVMFGLGLMIASSVGFAFASTAPALELSRLTQGVSVAIAWPSATAWLVGFGPPERRGELIGITARASIAGAVLGPVLGGIATLVGRAQTFGILAVAGVAVAIWAFRAPALPISQRRHPRILLAALRQRGVGGGLWLGLVAALFLGVLIVLGPLDLHRLGWSPVGISAVFLTSTALLAAASPPIGRWLDRRGPAVPVRVGLLIATAAFVLFPFIEGHWTTAAFVLAGLLAYGFCWVSAVALLGAGAEQAGADYALAFAVVNLTWAVGQFSGATLSGTLAGAAGDALPCVAVGAICLITLGLLRGLPRAGRATVSQPDLKAGARAARK
jgi:predicted MFS family arabinose efflux permease